VVVVERKEHGGAGAAGGIDAAGGKPFDVVKMHRVGAQKQRGRDNAADGRGSFEVEHKFKGRGLFNGKIGRRRAA